MAKYLLLIYGVENEWAGETPAELERKDAGHRWFAATAGAAVTGGHELMPPETATSLRRGDTAGRPLVTDGPFLETKEGIGGYYVLEAADLDAAIALAALLPELADGHSGVEIRPIREHR
ncbi:YciI family protein [Actinoplanes sp. NPDC049599]|uniref:YciI family protein n=1 Tax=Actinoplanes sp. NPDC049599 TaxID=3363903 RepID=UPI0037B54CAC